jgi:hypothetical protein
MSYTNLLGQNGPEKDSGKPDNKDVKPAMTLGKHTPSASGLKRQGNGGLWVALIIVVISVAGAAGWGYHQIESDRALFEGFDQSDAVQALQSRVNAIDGRISTLVSRVATSDIVDGLRSRVDTLETTFSRGLEATRSDVADLREATGDIDFRIQSAIEERTSSIRAQLAELESSDQSRASEIARLETALDEMRRNTTLEFADLRQNEAAVNQGLENRLAGTERRVDVVAYAVDRDRVDFELYRDMDETLAPGIVLHLSDVDRRYQRVNGWVHLVPEGRFLRINNHPIQQALVFYTHQDDRPHELVLTRVTETAAVGYIHIPSESTVQTAEDDWTTPSVAVAAND